MPRQSKNAGYRRMPFSLLIHPLLLEKVKEFAAENRQSINDVIHDAIMNAFDILEEDLNLIIDPIVNHKHSVSASRSLAEFRRELDEKHALKQRDITDDIKADGLDLNIQNEQDDETPEGTESWDELRTALAKRIAIEKERDKNK